MPEPVGGGFAEAPNFSATGMNYSSRDDRQVQEGSTVSGVFVSDYDNDALPEILLLGGEEPVLYERNVEGEMRPADRLPSLKGNFTSALFFDYDNDGWDDLYLLNHQSSNSGSVFLQNNEGQFRVVQVGLDEEFESARGAAAADYDSDGCLDVFVVQANDWSEERPAGFGEDVDTQSDNGNPNELFDGDCEDFEKTTDSAKIRGESWSLATSFVDLTGDGLPDIHVANDFNEDVLYINEGDGSFERRVMSSSTNRNGMSSEVADVNGDGHPDVFVSNIYVEDEGRSSTLSARYGDRIEGNNLLINDGSGSFQDEAEEYGVRKGHWGWSALLVDFDNDRQNELYQAVSEGYMSRVPDDLYWDWNGSGYSRSIFDSGTNTYGAATLDVNRDGRMDVVSSALRENFSIHLNKQETRNWLQVELEHSKIPELGTEVLVKSDYGRQRQVLHSNVDYFSQSERVLHFGLGEGEEVDLEIIWNNGETTTLQDVPVNQRVKIDG